MKYGLTLLFLSFMFLPTLSYGGSSMMKDELITEEQAVEIATEFLKEKQYDYEIDWKNPQARLDKKVLKEDGSLSGSFLGKKVWVWHVWFLPSKGLDPTNNVIPAVADIDAKTGKVFTKYSMDKL